MTTLQPHEKKHLQMLRPLLSECTVLLKNDSDFRVPAPCPVALYGNGIRHTRKGGTGSGEVNSRFHVTVEAAFKKAGFTITTGEWLDAYDEMLPAAKQEFSRRMRKEARTKHQSSVLYMMGMVMPEPEYEIPLDGEGELAVYVLSRICGEGNDRKIVAGDYLLTESEIRDILELNRQFEKFLLVLNVGGPMDLTPVMEVKNILLLSQLGVYTGSVVSDLVLGKIYPSGKLATTWVSSEDALPAGTFGEWADTEYKEGIYVGYRYYDTAGKKPLFPFGYGLSFTTFTITPGSPSLDRTVLTIPVQVTNTGKEPGKEVVQVYATLPEEELKQPLQMLAAFQKTPELAPGETCELTIPVDLRELASYSMEEEAYLLEAGDLLFRVGSGSRDLTWAAVLELPETVILKKVQNLLGDPGFEDLVLDRPVLTVPETVPHLMLDPGDFSTDFVDYSASDDMEPGVRELTDEELVFLSVGNFNPKGGITSLIGEASTLVCGAAGETSGKAADKGIPPLVMADGPAGIRISRSYYRDEKGSHSLGSPLPGSMTDTMGPAMKLGLRLLSGRRPKNAELLHQYCTAIPIGTAIAQSFNTDLARVCGDIVGAEMELFHVDLWLAPALNIHRNILCGRNFEYYSEDPLISGRMAAALTLAVQAHSGCGTTIKHYAANNQETNRYYNNSHVSERAMREIYLKGFEICVKESQPAALMTSYNLLNGTHTSELHGLNEDILRKEFGFRGLVMTDWVVSMMKSKEKYPAPDACLVAASGNDVFMPGSKKEYDRLMEGLASGEITREQLEYNVSRIIRVARRLRPEE